MVTSSGKLIVQCQIALGLTQKKMGDLLGVDRRTIQRWQDRGTFLLPSQAETLANALRPEHPELAAQVLARGGNTTGTPAASPEVIEAIVGAAAAAGGGSPEGIRAAVAAAFGKAVDAGVDAKAVVAGLKAESKP